MSDDIEVALNAFVSLDSSLSLNSDTITQIPTLSYLQYIKSKYTEVNIENEENKAIFDDWQNDFKESLPAIDESDIGQSSERNNGNSNSTELEDIQDISIDNAIYCGLNIEMDIHINNFINILDDDNLSETTPIYVPSFGKSTSM